MMSQAPKDVFALRASADLDMKTERLSRAFDSFQVCGGAGEQGEKIQVQELLRLIREKQSLTSRSWPDNIS